MQKIHLSIFINAPREKVWNTMLGEETYKEWTKGFSPGSRYEGNWNEEGSKILFLGTDEKGNENGGMVSRIAESRPYEFVSVEHLGIVRDGVEDTTSEEARKWSPAFENYTFNEKDGGTELVIDQDIEDQYKEEFEKMWLLSLETLKNMSEQV